MASASMSLLMALLVVTAQLPLGLTLSSTVPAFLWSPNLEGKIEMVDYRTLAPRDLVKSAMTEGGWSRYLCSGEDAQQSKNFAFLFIGKELQSQEISRPSTTDPALVDLLKGSFSNSSSSMAFPYVAAGEENESIESSLISEFSETCQQNTGISSIALVGSCSVDGENFAKLNDVHSVHDYLNSRIKEVSDRHTDLIVLCPGGSLSSEDSDQPHSESSILSQLLNSANQLGAKYSVLYISDPLRSSDYLSRRGIERFLAEGTMGTKPLNSTLCDGVCQIKSSLLEGILVGIVLLVILISGLCCMMGIDTPTRFEAPQDS